MSATVINTSVLGTAVSAVDLDRAIHVIHGWLRDGQHHFVCVRDAHGIVRGLDEPWLRDLHARAGLVVPDGWPVAALLRWRGYRHVAQVRGCDLMRRLCADSIRYGYRHFFYGGAPGVAEELAGRLGAAYPGLQVAGVLSPPYRNLTVQEDERIIRTINAARADIVWVGLSTPKQELWMDAHRDRLAANVQLGVGAAFDFLTGRRTEAPGWVRRSGLEWAYRMACEPRRLGPRYLHVVPRFLAGVAVEAVQQRPERHRLPQPKA
ncbi:WecB/TagA/CpsF family glycosyltransferase [Oleisolibacter albus]|uniref:WecB/TagA/CpsF family glycosyltransferase n=1 Tax=Oleisolibacter albus TaxID=2171757 RepID=UPI000DF4333D|nr:WecB/TagA/CpsF family glycosyltransferase [Oleisolibacter albus]